MSVRSQERFFLQCLATLGHDRAIEAYQIAKEAHKHQKRHNGAPYSSHLVSVGLWLLGQGVRDEDILTAALLHDLVEDTDWTISAVAEKFGANVARLVGLVTKPENMPKAKDNYEAYKLAMQKYLRAIEMDAGAALIKAADRIHNFGTLLDANRKKRREQAEETRTFFLPFFKRCRNRYPQYAHIFFAAKISVTPTLEIIEDYEHILAGLAAKGVDVDSATA